MWFLFSNRQAPEGGGESTANREYDGEIEESKEGRASYYF
jgi:hypothetical protein